MEKRLKLTKPPKSTTVRGGLDNLSVDARGGFMEKFSATRNLEVFLEGHPKRFLNRISTFFQSSTFAKGAPPTSTGKIQSSYRL